MISILLSLLVLAVVIYVAYLILGYINLPEPINKIVTIILGLIFLLVLLQQVGLFGGPLLLR